MGKGSHMEKIIFCNKSVFIKTNPSHPEHYCNHVNKWILIKFIKQKHVSAPASSCSLLPNVFSSYHNLHLYWLQPETWATLGFSLSLGISFFKTHHQFHPSVGVPWIHLLLSSPSFLEISSSSHLLPCFALFLYPFLSNSPTKLLWKGSFYKANLTTLLSLAWPS